MAETVGLLILSAAGATEAAGIAGLGTIATTTIAGTSLATVVGTAAITAAAIGLNYALSSAPEIPKPEDGSQAFRQAIPPRIRGYWVNRLAGNYVLFEASESGGPPAVSYDVIAFHSGKIDSIITMYLSDDEVTISGGVSSPIFNGSGEILGNVDDGAGGIYGSGKVSLQFRQGLNSQNPFTFASDPAINGIWTSAHVGNGIASAAIACSGASDPTEHTRIFPRGRPELSVAAKCAPIWDPRDNSQSRLVESTWKPTPNPVLQLIDYLTGSDNGGPGLDYATVIEPVLEQWKTEATLCDNAVSGGQRYQSAGWYQFDNKPEDVIGKILSTCDGWLSENGDGTLSIVVGYYREPEEPALTAEHIVGFSVNHGTPDEERVNQLDITITDPSQKYVSTQLSPVRNEDSISTFGLRSQTLDLTWVQWSSQAIRLANRALLRLNPAMSGTFITTLYGFRYFGKRWVKVQFPYVAGLTDCVVEIQSVKTDLLNGRITFEWKLVDTVALADSQALPKVHREDDTNLIRENSSAYTREAV